MQPAGRPGADRSHSRVHGPPGSQADRQSSRVAEHTLKPPISCPDGRHHLAQRDAAPVELRHPTTRDLRPDRDLTGSRSDLPAPFRTGRPPGRDRPISQPPHSIQPITGPRRAPCRTETAKSFMGAPPAERIGRAVEAEGPIRRDEAALRVREAAGVARSGSRTRKQMRRGAQGAVQRGLCGATPTAFAGDPVRKPPRLDTGTATLPRSLRNPWRIASEEMGAAPAHFPRATHGIEPREAAHEARRLFGFRQAGRKIVERFRHVPDETGVREGFPLRVRSAADRPSPLRHRSLGAFVTASPLRLSNRGRPAMHPSPPFSGRTVLAVTGADLLFPSGRDRARVRRRRQSVPLGRSGHPAAVRDRVAPAHPSGGRLAEGRLQLHGRRGHARHPAPAAVYGIRSEGTSRVSPVSPLPLNGRTRRTQPRRRQGRKSVCRREGWGRRAPGRSGSDDRHSRSGDVPSGARCAASGLRLGTRRSVAGGRHPGHGRVRRCPSGDEGRSDPGNRGDVRRNRSDRRSVRHHGGRLARSQRGGGRGPDAGAHRPPGRRDRAGRCRDALDTRRGMSEADRTERIRPVRSADLSCGPTDSRPGRGIQRGGDRCEATCEPRDNLTCRESGSDSAATAGPPSRRLSALRSGRSAPP